MDEVHERDLQCDFLLILLRDLLAERPDLKVSGVCAGIIALAFASLTLATVGVDERYFECT